MALSTLIPQEIHLPTHIQKVLILGLVWPEPNSTGASVRIMEHIRLFQDQGWAITFASPAAPSEFMADLTALGMQSQTIAVNDDAFDDFIEQLQPTLVLFDRFLMEEQFAWRVKKVCPNAIRIIETIDLHCLREARHQALKQGQPFEASKLHNDTALREIAAIYRSDLSIVISDVEQDLLHNHFNISPALIHLCPFMLDEIKNTSTLPSFEQRQHFMTIGNFRHAPNWDAVLWLKQAIWPLIRNKLPQAELHIYGAYTPPKATDLHNPKEGFFIQDRAESVPQVMQSARICLAPLRFGAGIKTKLADAMCHGTPNVSTNIGAEGMSGGLSWSGEVQDDAKQFAEAAVALYQDRAKWDKAQQYGYDIVNHHFNRQKNSTLLLQRILDVQQHLEQQRQTNFIGAILNHHHHKSTEFMSRWITLKNNNKSNF